jgi:hypothetical protein
MICYFLTFFADDVSMSADHLVRLEKFLGETPGMSEAKIFTPARAHDPYLDDGAPPPLLVESYFPTIEALEAVIAADGYFRGLPGLPGAKVTQQAMLARRYPVPQMAEAKFQCTYVVSYEGVAEDLNLWLSHYIQNHPPIMARFPGIREIEVCTRIDWCSGLDWPRVDYMQRNKTVFDNAEALNEALNSPVRDEMRRDYHNFPPFSGKTSHYPMSTLTVAGAGTP